MASIVHRKFPFVLLGLAAIVAALVFFWNWDWFVPLAEAQASAALGRKVTLSHLHVRLGWQTEVAADDVTIANPPGFTLPTTESAPFVSVGRLTVVADVRAYLHGRHIVLPLIEVQKPIVLAAQTMDGQANWNFPALSKPSPPGAAPSPAPEIGVLRIIDGQAHVLVPKMRSDFTMAIATEDSGTAPRIVVDAKGTYAAQPITGHFVGGALLSLRDKASPYPVDLKIENGQTHVSLAGTLEQPLTFGGADLKLTLTGANMEQLYPLLGVPIPATPSYSIEGRLDYADRRIRFQQFSGRVGSSDLGGELDVDPTTARPTITGDLVSRRIDLADLGGFIGSAPGRVDTPDQTRAQRLQTERAEASPRLLPTTPLDLPKIRAADFHIRYRGEHILGHSIPFDSIDVQLDIVDGNITLHPATLGVGTGKLIANVALNSEGEQIHTRADVDFQRLDLSRIMQSTHLFNGRGVIGGKADLVTTGNSVAAMLGNGNGGLTFLLSGHGDISAILADLAGLQFGDALLSALGIPQRADLECFIGNFALTDGVLHTKTFLLDTSETRITAGGTVDLRHERLDMALKGEAKHFTIASLPDTIGITGTFKDPSILPDAGPLLARAGLATGLGVLFPPLALLPTIQLGLGEDNACANAVRRQPAAAVPRR